MFHLVLTLLSAKLALMQQNHTCNVFHEEIHLHDLDMQDFLSESGLETNVANNFIRKRGKKSFNYIMKTF